MSAEMIQDRRRIKTEQGLIRTRDFCRDTHSKVGHFILTAASIKRDLFPRDMSAALPSYYLPLILLAPSDSHEFKPRSCRGGDLPSEMSLNRQGCIVRSPANGVAPSALRCGPVEPRLDLKLGQKPTNATIKAIIDEWIVPALVEQFLASAGVARGGSAGCAQPELAALRRAKICT